MDCAALLPLLEDLYGTEHAPQVLDRLCQRLAWMPPISPAAPLSHKDALVITYGDQIRAPGEPPLRTLAKFAHQHFQGRVSGLHILPFFPFSSDDGFAVIDYRQVDPRLGGWEDIQRLGANFRLMIDLVLNHVSAESAWFQGFLRGEPRYQDYFLHLPLDADVQTVVRPRALPLLTPFQTARGEQALWTTFSADQIDLNYANPEVLLEMVDVLLLYAQRGAQLIRLDAIAYLWKELGTACIHLPQTHRVVQLLRALLDQVAPGVLLVTETNVPHQENLSYFGNGRNEAQLVYNFALPPLVMHALLTGRTEILSEWAAGLELPSDQGTFFNFLASHDGIGLNPVRDLLPPAQIALLEQTALAHGGRVSTKSNPDGSQSIYELNINYFDALSDPGANEPLSIQVARFMAAQAVLLALVGLPGIYIHSLLGSRNWTEGLLQTGRNRTINREKFTRAELERELTTPGSLRASVFRQYTRLLAARAASPAFHPAGRQTVLKLGSAVFGLLRAAPDGRSLALCLQNLSQEAQAVRLDPASFGLPVRGWMDLFSGETVPLEGRTVLRVRPYQALWLGFSEDHA